LQRASDPCRPPLLFPPLLRAGPAAAGSRRVLHAANPRRAGGRDRHVHQGPAAGKGMPAGQAKATCCSLVAGHSCSAVSAPAPAADLSLHHRPTPPHTHSACPCSAAPPCMLTMLTSVEHLLMFHTTCPCSAAPPRCMPKRTLTWGASWPRAALARCVSRITSIQF